MENKEAKGNWHEQKNKLKQKFAELTNNDLIFEKGRKEKMYAKIQVKLGITKEEFAAILATL
jgi:uncharacterized protein YjbJ (UPF0337 family)